MVTAETYHMCQCRCNVTFMWKVNFEEKIPVLPLRNFRLLVLPGFTTAVTAPYYPISSLLSVSDRLREVKNKKNFELLALKVVAVAYGRWSLTRGSQCSDLTKKLFVYWKTGRWGQVVATGGLTVLTIPLCLTDLQNVNITLRILFRPQPHILPQMYMNLGEDYDERVLPSITTEVLKAVVVRRHHSHINCYSCWYKRNCTK